jgi:hypothetical protein
MGLIAMSERDLQRIEILSKVMAGRMTMVSASNAKSPIYIATQYGEGYVWIATQSRSGPIDAFLIIGPSFELQGDPSRQLGMSLMDKLRDKISERPTEHGHRRNSALKSSS